MIINHVLADGTKVKSVAGKIIKKQEVVSLYKTLDVIRSEDKRK